MSTVAPDAFCQPAGIYLLSRSVGLPLRRTRSWLVDDVVGVWETEPAVAWPRWLDEISRFRAAIARLLHHDPAWFCPQTTAGEYRRVVGLPGVPSFPITPSSFPRSGASNEPRKVQFG